MGTYLTIVQKPYYHTLQHQEHPVYQIHPLSARLRIKCGVFTLYILRYPLHIISHHNLLPSPQQQTTPIVLQPHNPLSCLSHAHTTAVLSLLAVTILFPHPLNAQANTSSEWPSRTWTQQPVATFHRRAVRSSEAVTTYSPPTGLKTTRDISPEWPLKEE